MSTLYQQRHKKKIIMDLNHNLNDAQSAKEKNAEQLSDYRRNSKHKYHER